MVSQGFITNEPYAYEHDVRGWQKPVKFLLVHDDYPVYQNALAVRTDKLAAAKPCLSKLVPLFQRAAIDYVRDPRPINELLVKFAGELKNSGFTLSAGGVADAVQKQLKYGIVSNGTDGVFGSFDFNRIQRLIGDLEPVFAAQNKPIKSGLKPSDLATNEFLDKGIKL